VLVAYAQGDQLCRACEAAGAAQVQRVSAAVDEQGLDGGGAGETLRSGLGDGRPALDPGGGPGHLGCLVGGLGVGGLIVGVLIVGGLIEA
jgi:hypothetical protein